MSRGQVIYVYSPDNQEISQFSISANGQLVALNPAAVSAPGLTGVMTVEPVGQYLYMLGYPGNNKIYQSQINIADGTLSAPAEVIDTDKLKHGVDDVAKYENEQRRDTYGPEHGSGNPHLQPGELQKVWHPARPEELRK